MVLMRPDRLFSAYKAALLYSGSTPTKTRKSSAVMVFAGNQTIRTSDISCPHPFEWSNIHLT